MCGNMDEKLNQIFSNVNNWLKYAEAKNALIIVLNSTLIFGIINLYPAIKDDTSYILYMSIAILMMLISIIVALISFIPRLKSPYEKVESPLENDNLLYFGHIAKYTSEQYREKIEKILSAENTNKEFDMYYINQIIINSKITLIKFKQFEISAWFLIAAFLTPIGALILYQFRT